MCGVPPVAGPTATQRAERPAGRPPWGRLVGPRARAHTPHTHLPRHTHEHDATTTKWGHAYNHCDALSVTTAACSDLRARRCMHRLCRLLSDCCGDLRPIQDPSARLISALRRCCTRVSTFARDAVSTFAREAASHGGCPSPTARRGWAALRAPCRRQPCGCARLACAPSQHLFTFTGSTAVPSPPNALTLAHPGREPSGGTLERKPPTRT